MPFFGYAVSGANIGILFGMVKQRKKEYLLFLLHDAGGHPAAAGWKLYSQAVNIYPQQCEYISIVV